MSSTMLLLEAIGYLDEDMLERSEESTSPQRRKNWVAWAALAACVCLVFAGTWGRMAGSGKSADDSAMEVMDPAEAPDIADTKPEIEEYQNDVVEIPADVQYTFAVRYIRSGGAGTEKSRTLAVNSRQELEAYISANEASLSGSEFEAACLKYDDAFFQEKQLVVLALDGNSSSVSHEVQQLSPSASGWDVCVKRVYPGEIITTDIVYWYALVEVEAGLIGENEPIMIRYIDTVFCE